MQIGSDAWKTCLSQGAVEMGISIGPEAVARLCLHARELMRFNKRVNLTAITDPVKAAAHHYLDSLAGLGWIPARCRFLDIGSGGGFPGIPLKVMRPDSTLVLTDSVRKKVTFLKHVLRTLGLADAEAVQIRAQAMARQAGFAGAFDVVVSRALFPLCDFFRMARPLLCDGGRMIAWKGADIGDELETLRAMLKKADPVSVSMEIHDYALPYVPSKRSLVILSPRIRERASGASRPKDGPRR